MENLPPNDDVTTTVKSVDVVYQNYKGAGTRRLEDGGDSELRVEMNVVSDVYPGNPDSYSYVETINYGFENNFTGFLDMLKDASPYFQGDLDASSFQGVDGIAATGADDGPTKDPTFSTLNILFATLGFGAVAMVFAILIIAVKSRRQNRALYLEDQESGSWSSSTSSNLQVGTYNLTPKSGGINSPAYNAAERGGETGFVCSPCNNDNASDTVANNSDTRTDVAVERSAIVPTSPKSPPRGGYFDAIRNFPLYYSLYPIAEDNKEGTSNSDHSAAVRSRDSGETKYRVKSLITDGQSVPSNETVGVHHSESTSTVGTPKTSNSVWTKQQSTVSAASTAGAVASSPTSAAQSRGANSSGQTSGLTHDHEFSDNYKFSMSDIGEQNSI